MTGTDSTDLQVDVGPDVRLWTEVRGTGTTTVLLVGGIGSGALAKNAPFGDLLSEHVRLISYDRRGCGRSSGGRGRELVVPQAAVDVLAVLDAHGVGSATVVAACAGASIGLELLASAPDRVSRLLLHEPLLTGLLSDPAETLRYEGYRETGRLTGPAEAMGRFLEDHDLPYPEVFRWTAEREGKHWLENEVVPLTNYQPDLGLLYPHRDRITALVGEVSIARDLSFARITATLAGQLGLQVTVVPGAHSAYHSEPEAFARALIPLLTGPTGPGSAVAVPAG